MKNLLGLEVLTIEAQNNIKGGGKYAPSEIPPMSSTPTSHIIIFPKLPR